MRLGPLLAVTLLLFRLLLPLLPAAAIEPDHRYQHASQER